MPMSTSNAYDRIPYFSFAFAQTHPGHLASVATILGLRPAAPENCRVLEIGCASGGNLIPMAEQLPHASFVGIDLSVQHVVEGQDLVRELGLGNIQIQHRSIMDVGDDFGTFDYIICPSVFTMVAKEVQEKILSVCKRNLAANGITYISCNTLPGWQMRTVIRDMVLFHIKQIPQQDEQVRQARAVLDLFSKSVTAENNPYGAFLKTELEMLKRTPDSYLFHEYLNTENTPVYFHEFKNRAEASGLRFLADADMRVNAPAQFPKEINEVLQRLPAGHMYREQFGDFLVNRSFRQSLLCHADRQPNFALTPQIVANFYVAAPIRPQNAQPNLFTDEPETFISDSGMAITVRDPIVKSALVVLSEEWPKRLSFHVLRHRARARLDPRPVHDSGAVARDGEVLGMALLQSFASGGSVLAELSLTSIPAAAADQERPLTRAVNRKLAAQGKPAVNLRHELVMLGDFERHLLRHLDGNHTRADMRQVFDKLVRDNVINVQRDGKPVTDEAELTGMLNESINQQLARFARQSLLVEQ